MLRLVFIIILLNICLSGCINPFSDESRFVGKWHILDTTDYLTFNSDGRPIEANQYRMLMMRLVKPFFPKFSLYCTRHWCAIGQLIKTKIELKHLDVYSVRNWLGHSEIQTTMTYVRDAKQYMRQAPFDWFKYIMKYR